MVDYLDLSEKQLASPELSDNSELLGLIDYYS
jgi:hypothetical protein